MKAEKVTIFDVVTRLMMVILVLLFITVVTRILTKEILVKKLGLDNFITKLVFFEAPELIRTDLEIADQATRVDWNNKYPFNDGETMTGETLNNQHFAFELFGKLNSFIRKMEQKISSYTTDKVLLYSRIVEMANLYNQSFEWDIIAYQEYNGVIMLDDGYLTTVIEKKNTEDNVSAIFSLKEFLDSQGIGLIYVQIPYKVCRRDTNLSGVIDFSNQNADKFLSGLRQHQIKYIDLRDELHQEGLDHHELFYKTDHHWKTETGLWAAGVISKHLNEQNNFGIDLDVMNPSNYDYIVYDDWFFGSQGKKVTLSRAKPEDISLIYPKFAVDLSLIIPERNVNLRGKFDIIYDYEQIAKKDYINKNPLSAYIYGDNALALFTNNALFDGKNILVIGDSNDNVLVPFLALGIKNITSLDLRYFNGSLQSLIKQNKYDLVIVNYYPGELFEIDYPSHLSPFDFR